MKTKLAGGIIGTAISSMGLVISTAQLEQIISIICSVGGLIIVLTSSLLIPFIKWLKKAKEDGKITKEELEEGKQIVSNGIEDVKNAVEDVKNKKK